METLFWISTIFIVYTYVGYPVLIWGLARLFPAQEKAVDIPESWPLVSIVIPVYNESANLDHKLDNLRQLNYPSDRLQIIFVSDGSTDDTVDILRSQTDIHTIAYPERQGKPTALNHAMEESRGEIVVFTDARQTLDPGAVRNLVLRLLRPGIGAVSGELCHLDADGHVSANVGLYWRYEKWIRKAESRFHSTAGVTGALYAIYRKDYQPLLNDTLLDDFQTPINILREGKRVVFESTARVFDTLQQSSAGERARKIRTLAGNFQAFVRNKWLFVPVKNPILWQFLSHKVFRLLVPYAMVVALLSSFLADGWFYGLAAGLQGVFYLLGGLALLVPAMSKNRILSFVLVFLELNAAAVIGLLQFLTGRTRVKWQKT